MSTKSKPRRTASMISQLPTVGGIRVNGCARCGGSHALSFKRLSRPVGFEASEAFTHWASCPTNGEPILMAFVEDGEGAE